ncbi:hypothetical protein PF66_01532 [Pseudomonas asplenii]|uniref:Uncharacterized protein n=1 Tax=Pseudomonas asplenii TaxID=53407 RepID=A0A0M9GIA6_9PSED|nr:hypothetical protein PF66_01532 [Pseudomonas fuscovaginae]KPA95877.1 hypothetical protein PF70_04130 [Pseudomonas fuscovaginae]
MLNQASFQIGNALQLGGIMARHATQSFIFKAGL